MKAYLPLAILLGGVTLVLAYSRGQTIFVNACRGNRFTNFNPETCAGKLEAGEVSTTDLILIGLNLKESPYQT